jgi:hypothetical protein
MLMKTKGVTGLPYIGFTAEKNFVCICLQRKIYYFSFGGWMKYIYSIHGEKWLPSSIDVFYHYKGKNENQSTW